MSDGAVRRRVLVSGFVQGVWFRESCRSMAEGDGVRGWVANRRDGRVEALFEGPPHAVDRMIEWCHHGPGSARVDHVEVVEESPEGLTGFDVR